MNVTTSFGGKIETVSLISGPVGSNLIDAKIIISGTGTGAEILPVIDLNVSSPNYGMLTGFDIPADKKGTGYNSTDLEFSVIPVVRAVNEGIRAEVEYIRNQPDDAMQRPGR